MRPSIGILALGTSNRQSIAAALERCACAPYFVESASQLSQADAIVLPGVAHFGFAADALDRFDLRVPLQAAIERGVPVLGICAGFQLLFDGSEEAPGTKGLGFFAGAVRRLRGPKSVHMGWNRVEVRREGSARQGGWAYFAHTFAPLASARDAIAYTSYGKIFTSAACRSSVTGVQFHPERSGAYGADLLRAFVESARCANAC